MIVVNITLGGPGDIGSARSNLIENRGKGSANEKRSERLGGLVPRSEVEKSKFQELVLCSSKERPS